MNIRILAVTIISAIAFVMPVQAQTTDELRGEVQRAVCQNDWDVALTTLGRIIGSDDISIEYRESLMRYRRQIQTWQDTNTVLNTTDIVECQSYLGVGDGADSETVSDAPPQLDWNRAVSVIQSSAPVQSSAVGDDSASDCDPSYPSMCIPSNSADLDCGDIVQRNFTVLGSDPHGFDGDRDGVGCEHRE